MEQMANNNMDVLKTKELQIEQLVPLWKERLEAGQKVQFSPKGISMLPMLRQGRDSVQLALPPERLKRHDIIFYQRDDGKYVLHRIIKADEAGLVYTCLGDNQFVKEHGLRRDQVIAIVTEFTRGKRRYNVTDPRYRLYCFLWHYSRPVRFRVCQALRKMFYYAKRLRTKGD